MQQKHQIRFHRIKKDKTSRSTYDMDEEDDDDDDDGSLGPGVTVKATLEKSNGGEV